MGEHDVKELNSESLRAFTRKLLGDLQALDLMLQHGAIESGVRRIGAEQELFLVDRGFNPAPGFNQTASIFIDGVPVGSGAALNTIAKSVL